MLTSNELELKSSLTLGTLTSNAEQIKQVVLAKLQEYTPENYIGRVDEAKNDKALLNKAEKALNERRLQLEREYMEPFSQFKILITETCKAIKEASAGLDTIVKAEEQREKEEKFEVIQEYWNNTGFTLFDISQVFNSKWTNKTAKLKDVYKEIDAIQKKALDDLKVLENFPAEDVPLLKTVYLETLDITEAMNKAEQLKQNRAKLVREETERRALEQAASLKKQGIEEFIEEKETDACDLAAAALGLTIEQNASNSDEEYALVFHGSREVLQELKRYMTTKGIVYEKLVDKGNGVYSKN